MTVQLRDAEWDQLIKDKRIMQSGTTTATTMPDNDKSKSKSKRYKRRERERERGKTKLLWTSVVDYCRPIGVSVVVLPHIVWHSFIWFFFSLWVFSVFLPIEREALHLNLWIVLVSTVVIHGLPLENARKEFRDLDFRLVDSTSGQAGVKVGKVGGEEEWG